MHTQQHGLRMSARPARARVSRHPRTCRAHAPTNRSSRRSSASASKTEKPSMNACKKSAAFWMWPAGVSGVVCTVQWRG